MARHKTYRKKDYLNFPFCFKEDTIWKGKWSEFFGNDNPIILELGCGKGETVRGLARLHSDKNYVGIDMKSDRMWVGARVVDREGMKNVAFQRMDIIRLPEFFGPDEVDEIWITFPDPFPRMKNTRRRLTHERYLHKYAQVLKPNGILHFKTDNEALFKWTLEHYEEIALPVEVSTFDLHSTTDILPEDERKILTRYEQRFHEVGKTTKYLRCHPDTEKFKEEPNEKRTRMNLAEYGTGEYPPPED